MKDKEKRLQVALIAGAPLRPIKPIPNYAQKDLVSVSYICEVRPFMMAHNAREINRRQFARVREILQNKYGNRYLGGNLVMPRDEASLPCIWLINGGVVEVGNRDTYGISPNFDKGSVTLVHSTMSRVNDLAGILDLPKPRERQYEAVHRH